MGYGQGNIECFGVSTLILMKNKIETIKPQRIFWMDFLRAIAISFVLLLHVVDPFLSLYRDQGNRLESITFLKLLFIHEFALIGVPFFLMLSGALILKQDLFNKKHLYRILRLIFALIITYVVYQSFIFIFKGVYPMDVLKLSTGIFTGNYIVGWWGSWYLYVIISLYILAPFLFKLFSNLSDKELKTFLWLFFLISIVLNTFNGIFESTKTSFWIFPYIVPGVCLSSFSSSYLFYFILGYAIVRREFFKKISNLNLLLFFCCFLAFGIGIHYCWYLHNIIYGKGLEIETLTIFVMSLSFFYIS